MDHFEPLQEYYAQIWVDRNFNQQHIYGRWQSISDLLHSYNKLEKPKHICLNFREIFYQIKCTIFLSTQWYFWYPTLWKKSYWFQEKDKKNNFGPVCAIFAVNMGFSIFVILHFPAKIEELQLKKFRKKDEVITLGLFRSILFEFQSWQNFPNKSSSVT